MDTSGNNIVSGTEIPQVKKKETFKERIAREDRKFIIAFGCYIVLAGCALLWLAWTL